ncbi:MAG: LysE family transporter [Candidatus Bathyarchaeia archaeon]|nr:LysE family transporter [Candidatus Bathyarchaeota archaeon]
MINLFWITSSSFLAALSGATVPGPVFAVVFSESIKNGKAAGPLIILGHFSIEGVMMLMAFTGLQHVLQFEGVKMAVGYIGGIILVLMGLKSIFDAFRMRIDNTLSKKDLVEHKKTPMYKLISLGFLTSCSNPYFFLWWLTTGFPIMINSISIAGALGFILFLVGHSSADLLWFSFVSYSAHESRRVLNEKALKIILLVSSAFLVTFAAHIILSTAMSR